MKWRFHIGTTERIRLNDPRVAAMLPFDATLDDRKTTVERQGQKDGTCPLIHPTCFSLRVRVMLR